MLLLFSLLVQTTSCHLMSSLMRSYLCSWHRSDGGGLVVGWRREGGWMLEKLVIATNSIPIGSDHKYALQPRFCFFLTATSHCAISKSAETRHVGIFSASSDAHSCGNITPISYNISDRQRYLISGDIAVNKQKLQNTAQQSTAFIVHEGKVSEQL